MNRTELIGAVAVEAARECEKDSGRTRDAVGCCRRPYRRIPHVVQTVRTATLQRCAPRSVCDTHRTATTMRIVRLLRCALEALALIPFLPEAE